MKKIPEVNDEKANATNQELIVQRLKSKRLLLVLDDVWTYHEDEWKKLLAPFKKVESKGNFIIVTTRIPMVAEMVRTTNCCLKKRGNISKKSKYISLAVHMIALTSLPKGVVLFNCSPSKRGVANSGK